MKNTLLQRLRTSPFSTRTFNWLFKYGIDSPIMQCLHFYEAKKSKTFFKSHVQRFENIKKSLTDDESRAVYEKAVLYRQTFKRQNAPPYEPNQYFPSGLISLTNQETFVDCGAFNGDTVNSFLLHCSNEFEKIICLEPDPDNFSALVKNHPDPRITKLNVGAWNEEIKLRFNHGSGADSAITTQGTHDQISIPVVALDEVESCRTATFIKMDIEGAEMNALAGAERLIQKNRPKLAICIYHSDEDMLGIPEYLLATLKNYAFHVRHHSLNWHETVLYAIPLE